ncbi:MAG: DUF3137 domain-containing protein [Candidatus Saccharibacteria bacterium]
MIDVLSLFARGGGGGSGGGGGGAGIIVLPIVIISAIIAWWRRRRQIKKAKQELSVAEAQDPTWNSVVRRASEVFLQFQHDWSDLNVPSMRNYLTPRYFEHISLMMEALKQMNRQNLMSNLNLSSATIFNVSDSLNNNQDHFDIEMKASAHDELIDSTENMSIFVDEKSFTEVWSFDRQGNDWLLDKINQVDAETAIEKGYVSKSATQTKENESSQMQLFAERNSFYYNADFGRLLLPTRGELFTLANFGRSNINYHVIGKYRDVLVQFYQYIPVIADERKFMDYLKAMYKPVYRYDTYVIAQTILPKTYGDIIVKRKGSLGLSFKPSGMTQVSLEGVDFNKNFSVYATDVEKVTSLELLNPAYMQKLLDLSFAVNIEIVDNVLYLYSSDKKADFDTMLALLQNGFEEMKM